MLREFRVQDFALADDITVSLGTGLNIISGETGSGKSVLVNAISLLLGGKPGSKMVRAGCDRALLEAVFEWSPPEDLKETLSSAGVEIEDSQIILSREINESGRSVARINARAVPVSLLKNVGEHLADLHGQYQHQSLLRKSEHTEFIDMLGPAAHDALVEKTRTVHRDLSALTKQKLGLESERRQRDDERDLLSFRIQEIESLISNAEEFDALESDVRLLENASGLAAGADEAGELVCRSGSDSSVLNNLAKAIDILDRVRDIDPRLDEVRSMLIEADTVLDDAARSLRSLVSEFDADPVRLEEARDRLFEIKDLMKKNRCASATELLDYRDKALETIKLLDSQDKSCAEMDSEIADKKRLLVELAGKLSAERKKIADRIERQMGKELAALAMKGAAFKVEFQEKLDESGLPGRGGSESAEFMFSANPGEPPRPLSEVASGGELSRVMLAFKSLLNKKDTVPVLVFDEIDTGIGGVTAPVIGNRLCALGEHRQVISITHLPQIAAFADTHITVSKKRVNGRTVMHTETVRGEKRLGELCRMLGDSGERNPTLSLARQLIEDTGRKLEKE